MFSCRKGLFLFTHVVILFGQVAGKSLRHLSVNDGMESNQSECQVLGRRQCSSVLGCAWGGKKTRCVSASDTSSSGTNNVPPDSNPCKIFTYEECAHQSKCSWHDVQECIPFDPNSNPAVSVELAVRECEVASAATDCDDDNAITIDTCNIIDVNSSKCEYECNDGNACTVEKFVNDTCQYLNCIYDDGDVCEPRAEDCSGEDCDSPTGNIICDDDSPLTIDVCLPQAVTDGPILFPQAGCLHIPVTDTNNDPNFVSNTNQTLHALPDNTYFYETKKSISELEVSAILVWIKSQILQDRTPFCWRQSYGRGVGRVISVCPEGKEKIGALCYTPCGDGYSRQGTFDCQQECKVGWRDDGLFCRKPEYGRGAGYPWKFGDALNDRGMFSRCRRDHGQDGCEKWGLVVYPKCDEGYSPFGCCICRPSPTPDCDAEGYNGGFDLSCAVNIKLGDPTVLQCKEGEEADAGLCYDPCEESFDGVGPVCWQQCGNNQVNCGAGCASDSASCGFAVFEQVLGPIIVAANVATLGGAGAIDTVADTVTIAGKTVKISSKTGRLMWIFVKGINKLQSINPSDLEKGASVLQRIKVARTGGKFYYKTPILLGKVAVLMYATGDLVNQAFANDFVEMTTQAIADEIDSKLDPIEANYVKRRWAQIQQRELAESQGWFIGDIVGTVVGIVDITGVTDLVNAYAKPHCPKSANFPDLTTLPSQTNMKPVAKCRNVEIEAERESDCKAPAFAQAIGMATPQDVMDQSIDGTSDDRTSPADMSYFLDNMKDIKSYVVSDTPHTVTMKVVDAGGLIGTCQATVTVTDPTTSTITCPNAIRQDNDLGVCGAEVTVADPTVTKNCLGTYMTSQIEGPISRELFYLGTSELIFQVTDDIGSNQCSVKVTVNDKEPPSISCEGLALTASTDPGVCFHIYNYTQPVGTDNCNATTSQYQGPSLTVPYLFPVETTTNEFRAFDDAGNEAECSFDVEVLDLEKPTIYCPTDRIRPCGDTNPEKTGKANTTDNCQDISFPYLFHSDDTSDGISGCCPEVTARSWISTDWKDNRNECKQILLGVEPDALTDSSLCSYMDNTMNAIFTPDVTTNKKSQEYKLTSTTPGQFVYHAFHVGDPGEDVSVRIKIPYPFVTRGAKPVYANDWLDIVPGEHGEACFIPKGVRFFEDDSTMITISDYQNDEILRARSRIAPTKKNTSKGSSKSKKRTIEYMDAIEMVFDLRTPDTGFIHLSIDLDFGLKGIDNVKPDKQIKYHYDLVDTDAIVSLNNLNDVSNFAAAAISVSNTDSTILASSNDAVDADSRGTLLENGRVFEFSSVGFHGEGLRTVQNNNIYKDNRGVAGLVLDVYENPIMGANIKLLNEYDIEVGAAITDEDGHYSIPTEGVDSKKGGGFTVVFNERKRVIQLRHGYKEFVIFHVEKDLHMNSQASIAPNEMTCGLGTTQVSNTCVATSLLSTFDTYTITEPEVPTEADITTNLFT